MKYLLKLLIFMSIMTGGVIGVMVGVILTLIPVIISLCFEIDEDSIEFVIMIIIQLGWVVVCPISICYFVFEICPEIIKERSKIKKLTKSLKQSNYYSRRLKSLINTAMKEKCYNDIESIINEILELEKQVTIVDDKDIKESILKEAQLLLKIQKEVVKSK